MKKLIFLLLFIFIAITTFSQINLTSDTLLTGNGDTIIKDWSMIKFAVNFEKHQIEWYAKVNTKTILSDTILYSTARPRYTMIVGDTIQYMGNPYSTLNLYNMWITASDLQQIKLVNLIFKNKDPRQYNY